MYEVLEKGTNKVMGTRKTRQAASQLRDKLDIQYGSYRYYVVQKGEKL